MKRKFFSKPEVRRRAADYAIKNLLQGATVCDGAEVLWEKIAGVRRDDVWVIYRKQWKAGKQVIAADDLMVLCKRTGRVLFDGMSDPMVPYLSASVRRAQLKPQATQLVFGKVWKG